MKAKLQKSGKKGPCALVLESEKGAMLKNTDVERLLRGGLARLAPFSYEQKARQIFFTYQVGAGVTLEQVLRSPLSPGMFQAMLLSVYELFECCEQENLLRFRVVFVPDLVFWDQRVGRLVFAYVPLVGMAPESDETALLTYLCDYARLPAQEETMRASLRDVIMRNTIITGVLLEDFLCSYGVLKRRGGHGAKDRRPSLANTIGERGSHGWNFVAEGRRAEFEAARRMEAEEAARQMEAAEAEEAVRQAEAVRQRQEEAARQVEAEDASRQRQAESGEAACRAKDDEEARHAKAEGMARQAKAESISAEQTQAENAHVQCTNEAGGQVERASEESGQVERPRPERPQRERAQADRARKANRTTDQTCVLGDVEAVRRMAGGKVGRDNYDETAVLTNSATGKTSRPPKGFGEYLRLTRLSTGKHYKMREGTYQIGRSSSCALCLKNAKGVSRVHAEISFAAGAAAIKDLDSTNGITINGTRLAAGAPHPLAPGARFTLGTEDFEVG